jgi:PAS domain S-box-containing protein
MGETGETEGTGKGPAEELERLRRRVAELERELQEQRETVANVLRLAEAFGEIGENQRSAVSVFDVESARYLYVSPSYELIFKRSRSSLLEDSASWLEWVHPDDRQRVTEGFRRPLAGEGTAMEYRIVRPDGKVRWIAGEGIPVRSADGSVKQVVGQARDVTRRRFGIAAIEQSEKNFRRLVEANIIGIMLCDIHGRVSESNDALLQLLGYDRSDLPLRWDDITPPEWQHTDDNARRELAETGIATPWEKEYLHKDGHRVPVLLGVALLEGSTEDCISFVMDLTERKKAQLALERAHADLERKVGERTAELAAARDRLRLITDSLPVLIGYLGRDQRYQFSNATYERWYGLSRSQIQGRHVGEIIGDKAYALLRPHVERALAGEALTWAGDTPLPVGERYLHITLVPDRDLDKVRGIHVLVQDLTEQKRAQEDLRRAERLAAIGTLAAGIAHEINNPLGVILLAAETAADSVNDPARSEKAFRDIQRNAQRCARIVSNVLKFSRESGSEKRSADLNEVARRAGELGREYARSGDGKIDVVLADRAPVMLMNQTEMEQVIVNLIQNSLQAGARRIEIRTERREDTVRLSVRDDGAGIPTEHASHIFDPFYTGRYREGGTGLGLSILHGIVKDHGGTIEVDSEPGRGTAITAIFPSGTSGTPEIPTPY